jgi:alditol oxidase
MGDGSTVLRNWAGNVTFSPAEVVRPRSIDELAETVVRSRRVRVLGTGHSFSPVASTDGTLVVLDAMPGTIELDSASSTVRVPAGVRWGELAPVVHAHGFALANMGSLPHISVAGSAATGTHGSGASLGCLATSAVALEIVRADGSVQSLRTGDVDFDGSVVALGALGVVTALELRLVPAFDVAQSVWDDLPFAVATERFDDVMDAAYSVSLFTTWRRDVVEQVWVKRRTTDPDVDLSWTGAAPADGPRHPVPATDPSACTVQGGVPGPWFERLPHFRLEFTPSSGEELQTEYMVPREHAAEAIEAVRALAPVVSPVLQISEIRTVAADGLWLSPCYGRATVCLHFTWVDDTDAVAPAVRAVEDALAPYAARPHWGKVFTTEPAVVRSLYPRLGDVEELRDRVDPDRRFTNDFLDRYLR